MLKTLFPYLNVNSQVTTYNLPKWETYRHQVMQGEIKQWRKRPPNFSHSSPLVRLIHKIINAGDTDYFFNSNDHIIDRFSSLYEQKENYRKTITHVYNAISENTNGKNKSSLFSIRDGHISETLIPSFHRDYAQLPFDEPYSSWVSYQPLRVLSISAYDCPYKHSDSRYVFNIRGDVSVLLSIDPLMLISKYYMYKNRTVMQSPKSVEEKGVKEIRTDIASFAETLFKGVFLDIMDIWVMHSLKKLLTCNSINEVNKLYSLYPPDLKKALGSYYTTAMLDLYRCIDAVKYQSITPHGILSSIRTYNSPTLFERLLEIHDIDIPQLKQYMPVIYLRDRDMVNIVTQLYKHRGDDDSQFVSMKKRLSSTIEYQYIQNKIWDNMKNVQLKDQVHNELLDLSVEMKM